MGSHNLPKISRRRGESENFRIKAYSVKMDAVQALKSGSSPHQPYRTGGVAAAPGTHPRPPKWARCRRTPKMQHRKALSRPLPTCSAHAPGKKEKPHRQPLLEIPPYIQRFTSRPVREGLSYCILCQLCNISYT